MVYISNSIGLLRIFEPNGKKNITYLNISFTTFRLSPVNGQQKSRKSNFTKFGIAKDVFLLVTFGLVLATMDVYSDVALSYQFFTVNTTDYYRGTSTAPSSGVIVSY